MININVSPCIFGHVLIATEGIDEYEDLFMVSLGQDPEQLIKDFKHSSYFKKACLGRNYSKSVHPEIITKVLRAVNEGIIDPTMPLYLVGTPFQRKVWHELRSIKPGEFVSYKDIAEQIGHPKAVRAVGSACKANPVAIIIPCHRVRKSNGKDGGYRWGTDIKHKLLEREMNA